MRDFWVTQLLFLSADSTQFGLIQRLSRITAMGRDTPFDQLLVFGVAREWDLGKIAES